MKVIFKLFRFDPKKDEKSYYDKFIVETKLDERILDCLNKIRSKQDSSLSYRMGCGHGICGSDGLTINGIPSLACQKLVKDYNYESEITIEPLKFFSIIKDLVVDIDPFFKQLEKLKTNKDCKKIEKLENKENLQSIEELDLFEEAIKCVLCGCCVAACPITLEKDPEFIGPAALLRAYRYIFDSRKLDLIDRMIKLEKPHGIWSCKSHYKCTLVCPKKIEVTKNILKTKKKIREELHKNDNKEIN